MDISQQILSEVTVHMKYARYLPSEHRRETWKELITRNRDMHVENFPELKSNIEKFCNARREVIMPVIK